MYRWERIYLEARVEGLMKERQGRACKASGSDKGRPLKLDKKVEEDLIAENQRLRMEIEYLRRHRAMPEWRTCRAFFRHISQKFAGCSSATACEFLFHLTKNPTAQLHPRNYEVKP